MNPPYRHREYGEPTAIYRYTESHVICRYLHNGKKQILPWSLIDGKWQSKSAPKPRPLYNQQALVEGSRVVLVEGEKCVDHLKAMGISRVPICWPGGAQAVKHADWTPLHGRDVLLFPDHDQPGSECMLWIAKELLEHGGRVSVVNHIADDLPEGWDIADTDWNRERLTEWLTGRIQSIEHVPDVPRETRKEVTRGAPRSRANGSPAHGHEINGNTGSVFVSWERLGLECSSSGSPHPHLANAQRILAYHPDLAGRIWYDEFHEQVFQTLFTAEPTAWIDSYDTRLTVWIQSNLRIAKFGHQIVQRAVEDYARQHVRNEVREWMEALHWDGKERLPGLMAKAFGADLNDYTAAVGRCWMVSMAARTFEPGCKVDTMPVFEGPQGLRKSSALREIGGKWFSEMHENIVGSLKDFRQGLRGKLLIEIPELHAFGRADVRRIKGIISDPVDHYRASYGRRDEAHPRRGVFGGTTNEDDWNQDDTGARRFWPIACSRIDLDYLRERREQLFAEAVHRYKEGELWWDIDPKLAAQEQEKRREHDVWTNAVMQYCEGKPDVTVGEILANAIDLPLRDRGKSEQMRVASILRVAGWKKKELWRDGRMIRGWMILK